MSLLGICCLLIGVFGMVKLGWGALRPLPQEIPGRHQDRMEDLLALHAQHFPQLRQALSNGKTLEALLYQLGPEMLRQHRKQRDTPTPE